MRWTNESMVAAMEAVKNVSSIKRTALEHGVTWTTLQDRHLEKVVHGMKPGCQPYLTPDEGKKLCEFVQVVGKVGYGKTRKKVMAIAESVAIDKGTLKRKHISDGWFRCFMQRQPQLCLRKRDSTTNV